MKIKSMICMGLLLFVGIIGLQNNTYASCVPENEINWNDVLDDSELVFVGGVIDINDLPNTQQIDFEVFEVIKGDVPLGEGYLYNNLGISKNETHYTLSSTSVEYELGKIYKVYVQNGYTNNCTTKVIGHMPASEDTGKQSFQNSPKFIVKNVELMQDTYYPNELGFYEVEITDRDGNPVEMYVTGRIDYQAPWGPSNFSPVGNYDKQKQRFVGELTIPGEIMPGTYTLKLRVHGSSEQYSFSGISEVDFVIGERPNSFVTLFESSSLGNLMGENDGYSLGESRVVNVQLVQGHFYAPPITNHPASILVYGTDWEDFEPNLLEIFEVTSDSNGFIHKELILDDRNQCEYEVTIKSEFEGFEYSQNFDFEMTNTEIFYFQWNDEQIPVTVKGECSIPLSMNFDQPNKTMTIELDTSDAKKRFGIHFPHKLLDGELTVLVNGDVDFDNFSINKKHDETIVRVDAISNYTTVEIIGTSAIPEFQTITMLVLLFSMLPVILLRNRIMIK